MYHDDPHKKKLPKLQKTRNSFLNTSNLFCVKLFDPSVVLERVATNPIAKGPKQFTPVSNTKGKPITLQGNCTPLTAILVISFTVDIAMRKRAVLVLLAHLNIFLNLNLRIFTSLYENKKKVHPRTKRRHRNSPTVPKALPTGVPRFKNLNLCLTTQLLTN
jgi:hypothetical protein